MSRNDDRPSFALYLPLLLGLITAGYLYLAQMRGTYEFWKPGFWKEAAEPGAAPSPASPPVTIAGAPPDIASAPEAVTQANWQVRMFYRDGAALALGEETRTLSRQETPRLSAAKLAETWFAGPQTAALKAFFPAEVQAAETFIASPQCVVIDLQAPGDLRFPGGAVEECLAFAGLAHTMLTNFDEETVKSIRLLVNGEERQTLAGYLDLRRTWNRAEIEDLVPVESSEGR